MKRLSPFTKGSVPESRNFPERSMVEITRHNQMKGLIPCGATIFPNSWTDPFSAWTDPFSAAFLINANQRESAVRIRTAPNDGAAGFFTAA